MEATNNMMRTGYDMARDVDWAAVGAGLMVLIAAMYIIIYVYIHMYINIYL